MLDILIVAATLAICQCDEVKIDGCFEPAALLRPSLDFEYAPDADGWRIDLGALPELRESQEPGPEMAQAAAPFGQADSWRWMVQAAYGNSEGQNHILLAGTGLSYFMADDISLEFELNLLHFHQHFDDAAGVNVNLLLRWHLVNNEARTWSLYADGGAGLMVTTDDVPHNGSAFNFMPQAGGGVSFDVGNEARMLIGVRWHHVSNGNVFEDNPGRDSALIYAQLSWPF